MPRSAAEKARLSARTALDKRAQALQVLDLAALSSIADYFVLCTGTSTTHVQTIAEAIEATLKAEGHRTLHREGVAQSGWVLLDYGDVLMHVFLEDTRAYYALERLWGDAPALPLDGV